MNVSNERFAHGTILGLLQGVLLSLAACNLTPKPMLSDAVENAAAGMGSGGQGGASAVGGASSTATGQPGAAGGTSGAQTGSAGASAGAGGATAAGSGGAASAGKSGSNGASAGVGASGAGGESGAGGASASSAASGAGGAAGNASAANFKDCADGDDDPGPCGTFTTQAGVKIQLGPYGAAMDQNVGAGFEVPLATGDSDGGATCASVVASFGEDPNQSKPLLDTTGINFALYTVYRPAHFDDGEMVPIITWGNGTCAKPEGYGALLRFIASYGYFVVAANSRWVETNSAMTKALDFAFAANGDPNSPYYHHLDTTRVGAAGHSQGGMATVTAAQDARVKTVIIFNGGNSAVKPFLAISGDMDIGAPSLASFQNALTGNPPGAYLFYHMVVGQGPVRGHLTLMMQPERVVQPARAWFDYQLLGDGGSRAFFVGNDCMLCNMSDQFDFGEKGLQ